MRVLATAVIAAWALAACGGAAGPPPVIGAAGPRLPPPPAIDPRARGAAYLAAVAVQIQPGWGQFLEDCRLRLPKEHALNAPGLVAAADLAIARDGRVTAFQIARGSGDRDFDAAVLGVLGDASPLPRPPLELESDDELVHLRWLFARDGRQAGPATAEVQTIALPLLGVVERLLASGAIARAAHRIASSPPGDPERGAATERVMIAALREGLASSDGGARRAAVEAVGRARVQTLVEPIHLLLVSTVDVDLRLAAVAAAAALGDSAAGGVLLDDYSVDLAERPRVALEKTAALVRLGRTSEVATAIRAAVGTVNPTAIAALALVPDPALAPRVASWLAHGDARVRAAACAALPVAAPVKAAAWIRRGLGDADATVRAACADAAARAARLGSPDAAVARRLKELLRDRDRAVRARAVAALAILEPASRLRAVADPAAEVRAAAAALASDAELRALAADRDADVRAAAVARLGDRAPDLIAGAVADGAAQVRRAAVAALADEAALERLARDHSPEVATAAQIQLAARRGRAAVTTQSLQRIVAAPDGGAERVRIALAWLLARDR